MFQFFVLFLFFFGNPFCNQIKSNRSNWLMKFDYNFMNEIIFFLVWFHFLFLLRMIDWFERHNNTMMMMMMSHNKIWQLKRNFTHKKNKISKFIPVCFVWILEIIISFCPCNNNDKMDIIPFCVTILSFVWQIYCHHMHICTHAHTHVNNSLWQ